MLLPRNGPTRTVTLCWTMQVQCQRPEVASPLPTNPYPASVESMGVTSPLPWAIGAPGVHSTFSDSPRVTDGCDEPGYLIEVCSKSTTKINPQAISVACDRGKMGNIVPKYCVRPCRFQMHMQDSALILNKINKVKKVNKVNKVTTSRDVIQYATSRPPEC